MLVLNGQADRTGFCGLLVGTCSQRRIVVVGTLTAAGTIDAMFSLLTRKAGMFPPTINYRMQDPALGSDVVPNSVRMVDVCNLLSSFFGFGVRNACLVLSSESAYLGD